MLLSEFEQVIRAAHSYLSTEKHWVKFTGFFSKRSDAEMISVKNMSVSRHLTG